MACLAHAVPAVLSVLPCDTQESRSKDKAKGAHSAERPRRTPSPVQDGGGGWRQASNTVPLQCSATDISSSRDASPSPAKNGEKSKAGTSKSHPGRAHEREWSRSKAGAHVPEAGAEKRKGNKGKGYVVDDDFAC